MADKDNCLFCRIAKGQEEEEGENSTTRILYDHDDVIIFRDIRPAAAHHYLVVPRAHHPDAKHLSGASGVDLVEKLVTLGTDFLRQQQGGAADDDARLGFHWPPFHSVAHLHLHVISPAKDMGWVARGVFKPGTWWFKSPDWVLQRLRAAAESSGGL